MATLEVTRRTGFYASVRKVKVEIDGQSVLEIARGATEQVELPSGHHSVVARVDWGHSPALDINCQDGTTTRLEVTVGNVALATLRTFTSPGRVFEVRVVPSVN